MVTYLWADVMEGQVADDVAINALGNAVEAHDAQLARTPLGVIKHGFRTTSSGTTTTEAGVLRVDGITTVVGRKYKIWTSNLGHNSSVAGDVIAGRIRFDATGAAATTSSTGLAQSAASQPTSIRQDTAIAVPYTPTGVAGAVQSLSVLLSVARIGGTGNASFVVSSVEPTIDLVIEDCGLDSGNAGVSL